MAVYTEVSDEALAAFLGEYDIGAAVAFRGIAEGVENSNFSLRTTAGDFILTLYEKRVDPAELPWFLGLMEHLAGRGITCPQPVRGRDGAAQTHVQRHHCALAEANERHLRAGQGMAGQFLVNKSVQNGRGGAGAAPALMRVSIRKPEPLAARGHVLAGLMRVGRHERGVGENLRPLLPQ